MRYDLVIFDCDGTLVNSEYLYGAITARLLNQIGYSEYTPELCIDLFVGQSWSEIRPWLENKHGRALPDDIVTRYKEEARIQMETDIQAVDHAHDMVTSIRKIAKTCVASNGERTNVIRSLILTGLMDFFTEETVFTKIQVKRGKPAPDLFLLAAEKMQADPAKTLVIEDSTVGITGAKAANMTVWGFTGTHKNPDSYAKVLQNAGADRCFPALRDISLVLNKENGFA